MNWLTKKFIHKYKFELRRKRIYITLNLCVVLKSYQIFWHVLIFIESYSRWEIHHSWQSLHMPPFYPLKREVPWKWNFERYKMWKRLGHDPDILQVDMPTSWRRVHKNWLKTSHILHWSCINIFDVYWHEYDITINDRIVWKQVRGCTT